MAAVAGDEDGFKIASAYVEVHPDLSAFGEEAKSEIDAETKDLGATVPIGADTADASAKIDDIRAKIDALKADDPSPKVSVQISQAEAQVAQLQAQMDRLNAIIARPEVTPQMAEAYSELDELQAKLDELSHAIASPKVEADTAETQAKIDEVNAKLDELEAKDTEVRVKASADLLAAEAKLDAIDLKMDELNGKTANLNVNVNESGGGGLSSLFSGGLFSPGSLGLMALGGGALLPALPGALTGAGAAAGTLGLALAGVSKALSDYSSGAKASTSATNSMASSQLSSAHTIQQAQQAVAQAETQAQHDAITSAEAIKNAQQNLTAAYQQAAQQRISAEQQLQNAEYSETQAQQALNQAREQAVLTIQQLNNAAADANLNAQQDQLNLEQAEATQRQIDANAKSTALQRAQAALSVKEAEQALKEALESRTNSQKAAQQADKQGVANNPQVLAAEHALQQAKQAVANAQRNLAQTEQASARTIAQAQQAVADAQRNARWQEQADALAVKQSQENLRYAYASAGAAATKAGQATSAYSKDLAKLTPAGRQFVTAITGAMGSLHSLEGAAEKALMPGLEAILKGAKSITPEITREVSRMGGLLSRGFSVIGKELESSGFQKELRTLFTEGNHFINIMGPAVNKLVLAFMKMGTEGGPALTGLAKGLSAILGGVGKLFTTLGKFSKAGGSILETLGKAIGAIGGPLGTVIGTILKAFAPLLKDALPLFTSLLKQIARIVVAAGPGLLAIGNALGQMLLALTPLAPQLGTLVVDLVKLADAALIPLLPVLPQLIPPLVQILTAGLKPMTALLPVLTPLIGALASVLAVLLSDGLVPVTGAIADAYSAIQNIVSAGITWMSSLSNIQGALDSFRHWVASEWDHLLSDATTFWTQSLPHAIENGVTSAAGWVQGKLDSFRHWVSSKWDDFWSDEKSFWTQKFPQTIEHAVTGAYSWVINKLDALRHGIAAKWDAIVSYAKTKWNELEGITQKPVQWIISNVYDKLIVRFWNDVAGPLGLSKLAKLSAGARLPGYGGGDVHPALLEGGETVVSKEDSRKPFMVAAFKAAGVPGYAGGGIVNDIGGAVSGAWDGLTHGLGETFHRVIGSIEHDLRMGLALPMKAAGHLINAAASHIPGSSGVAQAMRKAPGTLWGDLTTWVAGHTAPGGTGRYTGHYGSGVAQWRPDVLKVLSMLGLPASLAGQVLYQMQTESGGNPNAINLTDSNAAAGDPSRGLLQTIMTTFEAYRSPKLPNDIYNPMANIYAAVNYARHRYGPTLMRDGMGMGSGHGYDSGGFLMPGATLAVNRTGQPEMVLPPPVTGTLTGPNSPMAGLADALNSADGPMKDLASALNDYVAAHPGASGGGGGRGGGHGGPGGPIRGKGPVKLKRTNPGIPFDDSPWADPWGHGRKRIDPGGLDSGAPVMITVNYNGTKPTPEDHQAAMLRLAAAIGTA